MKNCTQGCLLEGTRILMADGSKKAIQDLRIGDILRLTNGDASRVENIWRGCESSLIELITASGMSIMLTGDHPMLLSGGNWTKAKNIKEHDTVCIEDGVVEVNAIKQSDNDNYMVYNLDIEGDNNTEGYFANGFAVGDMKMQNSLWD